MIGFRYEAMLAWMSSLALLLVSLFSTSVGAAGLWDYIRKSHYELFPEVNGTLTISGVPMEGLTVVQEAHLEDTEVRKTKTDVNGQFSFPEWEIYSRHPGLPLSEIRLFQIMTVQYQGKQYMLWHHVTGGFKGAEMITEVLADMRCDLFEPEAQIGFPDVEHPSFEHAVFSVCRWPDNTTYLFLRDEQD
ncbi:DUF6795 domain-containing protein [Marinobacter sp. OP 3.4]|uniref:DUF6795 domain-containing protein n=1 Tax=Marinobacter sp. OP 3.4 TaxID=3076501 RepID=UPI002E2033D3